MARLTGDLVKGYDFIDMGRPYVKFEVSTLASTTSLDYPQGENGAFIHGINNEKTNSNTYTPYI